MVWDHGPGRVRIKHPKATKEFLFSFVSEDLPKRPFEEVTAFEISEQTPQGLLQAFSLFLDLDLMVKEIIHRCGGFCYFRLSSFLSGTSTELTTSNYRSLNELASPAPPVFPTLRKTKRLSSLAYTGLLSHLHTHSE